jgi:Tfp pilus assembly protein PilN
MESVRLQGYRQSAARLLLNATDAAGAFVDELAAMKGEAQAPGMILRIGPSSVEVLRRQDGREERMLTAHGRPQEAVKRAVDALGKRLGQDCALLIAAELSVTGQMILPAEADDVLKAIIRNKVEGIAPWPITQSAFGQRVAPVAGEAARVAVDVAVVSRVLLEEVAGQLAQAGSAVRAASVQLQDGERLSLGFGARRETLEARRLAVGIAAGLGAFAAAVAAIGMLLVWQGHARLTAERAEMARLSASLAGQAGDATSLAGAANLLHERRRQRLPAVAVLEELSSVLPESVWLDFLSLDDVRIEFRGQGSGIPSLIEVLEQSQAFRDVNFSSATQFNADLNAEAFAIGATLEPATEVTP